MVGNPVTIGGDETHDDVDEKKAMQALKILARKK